MGGDLVKVPRKPLNPWPHLTYIHLFLLTIVAVYAVDRWLFINQSAMRAIAADEASRLAFLNSDGMTEPERLASTVANRFFEQQVEFDEIGTAPRNYNNDMVFEALLMLDRLTCKNLYTDRVLQAVKLRGQLPWIGFDYLGEPFSSLTYELYLSTGDRRYLDRFIAHSLKIRETSSTSPEGGVALYRKPAGQYLLIERVQHYAVRMARLGVHTHDPAFFDEAADQFEIYRSILRDPETGLWSQGRGWLPDPMALSPGAWSRGQGWLLWGMVETLRVIPRDLGAYKRLKIYFQETLDAVIAVQGDGGMWRQLLHLPQDDSYPDSSGTALIAYSLATAIDLGIVGDDYLPPLRRALSALRDNVTVSGKVLSVSEGPGPLVSIDPWLHTPGLDGDPHGASTLLLALVAEVALFHKPTIRCSAEVAESEG